MPVKKTSPKTEVKKSEFQAYKCYVTFHPSSVIEGGFHLEERVIEDFGRFARQALSAPKNEPPKSGSGSMVGFDTEYDPNARLLTVGVSDGHGSATAFETTEKDYLKKTKAVIGGATTLVGHSVAGDLDFLVKLGLAKDRWLRGIDIRDSFLLARMYDENRGKGAYGLETLLLSEKNFEAWKDETAALLKKTGNAADWSPEQRIARCRLDAWATVVLARHFEEKLNEKTE